MATLSPAPAHSLPPHHHPFFRGLQPSAMPPPTSVSPHRSHNPYPLPPKLEKTRLDQLCQLAPGQNVSSWRQKVDTPARDALVEIDANVGASTSQAALLPNVGSISKSTSKPSASTSRSALLARSVPRAPETPDVFVAPGPVGGSAMGPFASRSIYATTPGTSQSKRAGEMPSALASSKRIRLDPSAQQVPQAQRGEAHKVEEEKWRQKWLRSFPTLTFHFELGVEDGSGRSLAQRCTNLGAKVDQFFSNRISHLIVKGVSSPLQPRLGALNRREPPRSPMNPFLDNIGSTDLAAKAEAMGKKVWTVKKLTDMLDRLAPIGSLSRAASLHTLLEDEKIHGTRERDVNAPRPDYYYFKPGSKYLLIEDATGKHRTIMVKEYSYNGKEIPEYPVLHESFLRMAPTAANPVDPKEIRDRAWALYVEQKPWKGEQPPAELRRSTSLHHIPGTPKLPEPLPYQNASGNSVVITSNIASTSAANFSPAFPAGMPPLGVGKDKQMFHLSKRIQLLKGNASRYGSLKRGTVSTEDLNALNRRASTGRLVPAPPPKTFMTQEQVVKMLQQAREPVKEQAYTYEQRRKNREKVENGLATKEQDCAPGYCENCRRRYANLELHLESRKHRRFAEDDSNFFELDQLLCSLKRPGNPNFLTFPFPPCWDAHGKNDPCDKCCPQNDGDADDFEEESAGSGETEERGEPSVAASEEHAQRTSGSESSEGPDDIDPQW